MQTKAYLGIDVSKGYADFILLDDQKQLLEPAFELDDMSDDRTALTKRIESWVSAGLKQLYCGVESTGGYENNWYHHLLNLAHQDDLALKVTRLNPKPVKACREAGMLRTTNPRSTAHDIAHYMNRR